MIMENRLILVPQLAEGKTYSITIPKGSIVGVNGASFDGLATYTITTSDTTQPEVRRTIPAVDGEVEPGSHIEFVFNKPIVATGNWSVTMTWDDQLEEIDVEKVTIADTRLTIPIGTLNYKQCLVEIEAGSIADRFGNELLDPVQLRFHTTGEPKHSM